MSNTIYDTIVVPDWMTSFFNFDVNDWQFEDKSDIKFYFEGIRAGWIIYTGVPAEKLGLIDRYDWEEYVDILEDPDAIRKVPDETKETIEKYKRDWEDYIETEITAHLEEVLKKARDYMVDEEADIELYY